MPLYLHFNTPSAGSEAAMGGGGRGTGGHGRAGFFAREKGRRGGHRFLQIRGADYATPARHSGQPAPGDRIGAHGGRDLEAEGVIELFLRAGKVLAAIERDAAIDVRVTRSSLV